MDQRPSLDQLKDAQKTAIAYLKQSGASRRQIIQIIWGCKPGPNQAYREALAAYRELSGGNG